MPFPTNPPARPPAQVFLDSVDVSAEGYQTHVLEDEQADLFCCWAESTLLKFG